MPKHSIVMPVLLREDSHRQVVLNTLESVKNNSKDYEMIIVDDASPLLVGFLKDYADVYVRHKVSKGIAPSWNDGIAVSRGEYVTVINDDILVPSPLNGHTWLDYMSGIFGFADCGVCGPRAAGPKTEPKIVEDIYVVNEKFFPGYCFTLKRDRFLEKFNETFIPYNGEDVDYWWRIMQKGLKLYRSPIQIWHKEGDVIHHLGDYKERSRQANEQFKKIWGFDPVTKFYS